MTANNERWKTRGWRLEGDLSTSVNNLIHTISTTRTRASVGFAGRFPRINKAYYLYYEIFVPVICCSSRNKSGPPPWSTEERHRLIKRVRGALYRRAHAINTLPVRQLGGLEAFCGYGGAELVEHLERRWRQGCLICGAPFTGEPFEICHIDPLAEATDGIRLRELMELPNIGLSHISCNRRLGARPIR